MAITSVWKLLVPVVGFTLAVVAVCERGGAEIAEDRWNSRDRGRVIFAGVINPDSVFLDSMAVCVLHLPACSLEVYPYYGGMSQLVPPTWGPDGECLYYGTDSGIVRHSLRAGTAEVILSEEWHTHQGRTELMTVEYTADKVRTLPPPGIAIEALAHCPARTQETHYYWIEYSVDAGPPRWRFCPDSVNLPIWADQRVRERFSGDLKAWYDSLILDTIGTVRQGLPKVQGEPTGQGWPPKILTPSALPRIWLDLVKQDSLGNLSLVLTRDLGENPIPFGLTVTSKGDLLATWQTFVGRPNSALIHNLTSGESIVPEFPGIARSAHVRFSPDGQALAACIYQGSQLGIYLCRAPDYSEFERLDILHDCDPVDLCWSPDGEWLLVQIGNPDFPRTIEDVDDSIPRTLLVAVELETLAEVRIPWPFHQDGEPSLWHIGRGLDWIQ